MLNDTSNVQAFYQEQNIRIRKEIRQMDLQIKDLLYNSKLNSYEKQEIISKLNVNFLVIGPSKSGKTSLLKTMNFALNSTFNPELSISQLPGTIIKKYEIKKSKKYQIQGLTKVKQTDQKKAVSGIQFEDKADHTVKSYGSDDRSTKVFQKYSNALQMIDNRIFGCFKLPPIKQTQLFKSQSTHNSSITSIKTVLIVLNIISKIQFEQMSCMKFFLNDVRQKGIKVMIILTHVDKLNQLSENDKLRVIQQRIEMLRKQLDFKDRDDFICIQNYHELNTNSIAQQQKMTQQYSSSQSVHYNKNTTSNNMLRQNQKLPYSTNFDKLKYPYKKVSQLSLMEQSFRMQVPVISKHQMFNQTQQEHNYYQTQEKNHTVSRSITHNPTSNYSYAKVSAKMITSQSDLPSSESQNSSTKKFSIQNPQQSSSFNHHQYQNLNNSQTMSFKNSQQINFYSLKLLMKILQENDKLTQTEFKQKKIIKWFCG